MKILVFAYDLVVAGVTVNAIELAAALRDFHGHEVVLFAAPGPMSKLAEEKCLRFIPAPAAHLRIHPSLERISALRQVVRQERPDIVHAWDWIQCVDAYFYQHLLLGTPIVVTDMSMTLQRLLPKTLPTTFGIPHLVDQARQAGWKNVDVLLPPVDTEFNAPGAVDPQPFRARYGLRDDEITVVIVSRVDTYMKSEGLFRLTEAVGILGKTLPLRLVVVGDGDAFGRLKSLADDANACLQRDAVVLTGALVDPRPAYAAADIVVGMGGSALRGMAFAKPVIILGEKGFSEPLNETTMDSFHYNGIYGIGDGRSGTPMLVEHLRTLAEKPERLPAIGEFSRQFVVKHFALETVSARFAKFCEAALHSQPGSRTAAIDAVRTAAVWLRERRFIPFGSSPKQWILGLTHERGK